MRCYRIPHRSLGAISLSGTRNPFFQLARNHHAQPTASGGLFSLRHSKMEDRQSKRLRVGSTGGSGPGSPAPATSSTQGPSYRVPGLNITDHTFRVPLDHSKPDGATISLFVREVKCAMRSSADHKTMPWLVYLQGGPGFEGPRPTEASSWLKSAVNHFNVALIDQRGTGRSAPITVTNLKLKGDTPEQQAEYVSHFRADNIVRDCEAVRKAMVPPSVHSGRWTLLGQSFGGFCTVTYLSMAPEGVLEALLTGGLPPKISLPNSADHVYEVLHRRVLLQNVKYYNRFPSDVALVQRIVRYLLAQPDKGIALPTGTFLTPRLLQTLGLSGLGSGGGFERLHYLLDSFFDVEAEQMTPTFAKNFEAAMSWDTNPLYALLHEPIYCQGAACNWSADRIRDEHFAAEFDAEALLEAGKPIMFTGECVYRFMYDDVAALRPYKAVADVLAAKSDWGPLYDTTVLANNRVPAAAIAYIEDMYVDYAASMETAACIKGLRIWSTSEYRHSGIRDDGARVFDRLLGMARNVVFD